MDKKSEFERIYLKYFEVLYLFAMKIVKDPETSEDIVQDVFMECWARWGEIVLTHSIRPYLYKLTLNRSLDVLKRSESKNIKLSHHPSLADEILFSTFTSEDQLHIDDVKQVIDACIALLPEKCREVFLLSRHNLLRNKEISSKLGISTKTVEKHISKALNEIRNCFMKKGLITTLLYLLFTTAGNL